MKLPHLAVFLTLLTAIMADAGQEHLVKQKAKGVRDQSNERQGVTTATPAPRSPQYSPAAQPAVVPYTTQPAAPTASPQAAQINKSLEAIQRADSPTDERTLQLAQNLSAAARGSTKPSARKVDKLAGDLSDAMAGTDLSSSKRARLAEQLERALNDQLSAKEMEVLATDVHEILRDGGAGKVDATVVSNDIKSIVAEIQRGGSK